ncbi:hypothetical protein SEA_FRANCOB_241 [Streptomyces phage Francob]|nr:HNH endonuclease [Streptomyces phage Karp]
MKTFFKGENNPNWKGGIGQQFETEKLMKSLMTEETVKAIENIAKTVRSYSEIAREVGVPRSTVKRLMEKHEIPRLPPAPVFEVSDTRRNSTVRKAILDGDLISYVCECGQGPEWNGKPLVLQLDHINGDAYDNRLENLRFLCPNCHTQTDTFCGRNR